MTARSHCVFSSISLHHSLRKDSYLSLLFFVALHSDRYLFPFLLLLSIYYSLCCCSVTKSCPTLCDPMYYSTLCFFVLYYLQSLLRLMSIELVMPSNHLILCHPFLFLPSIFPSIRIFSSELAPHIRWPKYRSFSFSISPSNEHSGLISLGLTG